MKNGFVILRVILLIMCGVVLPGVAVKADMLGWNSYSECSNEIIAVELKQKYCRKDLNEAEDQIRYIESKFEETKIRLQHEIDTLSSNLKSAENERVRLEEEFSQQRSDYEGEIAVHKSKIDSLTNEISLLENQMAKREEELQKQIEVRDYTIQILKKDSNQKEKLILDDMRDLRQQYDADMMKAKVDLVAEKKQRIESLEAQRNEYELKLIDLKRTYEVEIKGLQDEMNKIKKETDFTLREQKKLLDHSESIVSRLKEVVRDREAEIATLRRKNDSQEAKLDQSLIQEMELTNQLDQAHSEVIQQKRLIRDKESTIGDLKEQSEAQRRELERMLSQERELADQLRSEIEKGEIRLKKLQGKLVINIDNRISFESGSAFLKTEIKAAMKKISTILANYPENQIRIEGHTDNQQLRKGGAFLDNWELSTARALSVLRYILENENLDKIRFSAVGYGEYNPIASNETPEGRALNRRVDIVVVPRVSQE